MRGDGQALMGGRCNIVQLGKRVIGKTQRSAGNVFAEVRDGRSAGNQQNIRGALEQPCERDTHRRCIEPVRN